jgi:methylated-DNA-[protein]-cysteine S-methyltransferase
MTYELATFDSPLGPVHALVRDGILCAMQRAAQPARPSSPLSWLDRLRPRPAGDPGGVVSAVTAYFAGDVAAIEAIETDAPGTPFQRRVWSALRTIPTGTTWSYGQLARAIGAPTASRAVGAANGANPCWIVVPCHRVIGASGALTGYAGGLDVKQWLLEHERTSVAVARRASA